MTIRTIKNGCIICGGDVRGNREMKYLCSRCNILYSEEHMLEVQKRKKSKKGKPEKINKDLDKMSKLAPESKN